MKTERQARYWMASPFSVLLVIRSAAGEVRWMEIRDGRNDLFHFMKNSAKLFFVLQQDRPAPLAAGTSVQIKAPAFVSAARAEGEATDSFIGDKLDAEAGMSAY